MTILPSCQLFSTGVINIHVAAGKVQKELFELFVDQRVRQNALAVCLSFVFQFLLLVAIEPESGYS